MYEGLDIRDYILKWLEAERELMVNWETLQYYPYNYEPINNIEKTNPDDLDVGKKQNHTGL